MNDKGQVYFSADDKEIPEEDAKRYQEAHRDLGAEAKGSDGRDGREGPRLEERTEALEAARAEAKEVAEAQKPKAQSMNIRDFFKKERKSKRQEYIEEHGKDPKTGLTHRHLVLGEEIHERGGAKSHRRTTLVWEPPKEA